MMTEAMAKQISEAPQAHRTSWLVNAAGDSAAMILHDANGGIIASAAYSMEDWHNTIARLCRMVNDANLMNNVDTARPQ